jgi:hypothetical protein
LCNIKDVQTVYKIKKALIYPTVLGMVIAVPVFADAISMIRTGEYPARMLVFASLFMTLFYLLSVNNLLKRVTITDTEIVFRSLFGTTRIPLDEITLIDGVTFKSRQFVTISSKKKSSWVPNSYDAFPELLQTLESKASEGTIGQGFQEIKANLVQRKGDIAVAWFVVLFLLLVIVVRAYQHFAV